MQITKHLGSAALAVLIAAAMLFCLLPVSVSAAAPASGVTLTFTDSGVKASGAGGGYEIDGTSLKITAAGAYTVTGSCAEGSITVKKGTTGVTLVLRNLTLSSSSTAPLSCGKSTETTLYISGTVTLSDNENAAYEDSDGFEGAAIKVKSGSTLTLAGDGALNVNGNAKNGIKGASEAAIIVQENIKLNINAANNGLASDGSVVIEGGTVLVKAGNDGIKSEPDGDDTASAGTVTIKGGTVSVDAAEDGVWTSGDLTVTGGTLTVISGDDAFHSDADVTVTGGTITVSAGDDAFHADYDLTIGDKGAAKGPAITVTKSYEGFEGARIYLNAGSGSVTASDDGVNAATDAPVSEIAIYINGGSWYINANGDGLDAGGDSRSNSGGSIYVNGGVTEVYGASNGGNAGLDYDSSCVYNGGTLLVVDYSGMNQTPGTGTYVFFGSAGVGGMNGGAFGGRNGFGGMQQSGFGAAQQAGGISIAAGSSIAIKDSSGSTVYSATGVKNANCVLLAGEGLALGETYTLYVNGSAVATAAASSGAANRMGGMTGQPGQQNQSGNQLPQQGVGSEGPFGQAPNGAFGGMNGMPDGRMGRFAAPRGGIGNPFGGQMGGMRQGGMSGMNGRFGTFAPMR